jgi:hypothetical protein
MTLQGAHLVGSVPLGDAETVFRTVSTALGSHLARLPDGETGVRKDWIAWQYAVLASTPGLGPVPAGDRGYLRRQLVHLEGGRGAPRFGPLGYADAALASFNVFDRLQCEGAIPAAMRFQVSLPTPLAPVIVFVEEGDRAIVEPAYELQLLVELRRIVEGIPHGRLAIQWDVAVEVALLEHTWPPHFTDLEGGVRDRLARLGAAVPRDVSLGYHLCYGDFGHRHFMSPVDASTLVRLAHQIASFARPPDWIHMPIPLSWTTPAAYAPLAELCLPSDTQLYLGLIHIADGLEGARRRIALAGGVVGGFGVATECGWGRRPPDTVPTLLELHAAALRSSPRPDALVVP